MKALSIKQPDDEAFFHWLAGFIDGEGCFFFHKMPKQFSPPRFAIKLRDDDREILEECLNRTGIGNFTREHERYLMEHGWCVLDRAAIRNFITSDAVSTAHIEILSIGIVIFVNGRQRCLLRHDAKIWAVAMTAESYATQFDDSDIEEIALAVLTGVKTCFPSTSPEMEQFLDQARQDRDYHLRDPSFGYKKQEEKSSWKDLILRRKI